MKKSDYIISKEVKNLYKGVDSDENNNFRKTNPINRCTKGES